MKRRIIPILAVLALLVTAVTIVAQAATTPASSEPVSTLVLPTGVQWIEIGTETEFLTTFGRGGSSSNLANLTAGMTKYYRLTNDITITNAYNNGLMYMNTSAHHLNVYLDLNGKTLTLAREGAENRLFYAYDPNGKLTVVNGTITNNNAALNAGGGLFLIQNGCDLEVQDVTINDTKAAAFKYSGGIISNNHANGNVTLTNVTVNMIRTADATANALGGAIYSKNGTLTMTDCTITATNKYLKGAQYGGLLYHASTGNLTMTRCNFANGKGLYGTNIYVEGGAEVEATDCTFTGGTGRGSLWQKNGSLTMDGCSFTGGTGDHGGNVFLDTVNTKLTDCTFENGTANGASGQGGNLRFTGATTITMDGCSFSGGKAVYGGNIYIDKATTTLTNCTVEAGTASTNGGNIRIGDSGSLTITGGIVTGGNTTGDGGNIFVLGTSQKPAVFNMTSGTVGGTVPQGKKYAGEAVNGGNLFAQYTTVNISGGELSNSFASSLGGNLFVSTACTMNISGTAVVSNGLAYSFGGNFYMSSTNSRLNIKGGTVSGGRTYYSGGNIYQNNGLLTITGGTITDGAASWAGGNIYSAMGYAGAGTITIKDDGNASTPIPQIINGTANSLTGGNIHVEATGNQKEEGTNTFVFGNFICSGGKAKTLGQDIYISAVTDLQVLAECAQTVRVYIEDAMLPAVGEAVLDTNRASCAGPFTGKLVLENRGNPYILGKADSTNLYLTTAALVQNDGTRTWYADNAAAVAAYASNTAYLQAAPGELALNNGTYTVDIGGYTLNFTGNGEVTCFDSSNDTFQTFGTATTNGPDVNTGFVRVGDKTYYTLNDNGTYSSHCVEIKIVTTSLRPSIGGIYFTGRWSCDDTLKPYIDGFGVVASTNDMPGDDFAEEDELDSKWSVFGKSDFASGVTKTGVMISGIVKDAASGASQDRVNQNAAYGKIPVHAAAYITIDGKNYTGLGKSYSLYDILKILSDNIITYKDHEKSLNNFMNRWSANGLTGEGWDDLSFTVSEEINNLNALYAGTTAYHGELHDHANTGGTSDGLQPLAVWKEEMGKLNMDFATIVDHKQILHMYLEDWDNTMFIGGSEAATNITDRPGVSIHYNMTFADPAGLEKVLVAFPEFNWKYYPEDHSNAKLAGGWHFDYPNFTAARFTELCEAIRNNGGFVSIVHPKYRADYITSDDPADAYFMEGQGIEVFYTFRSSNNSFATKDNYVLWTSLLKEGYKVYATAGNDDHDMPSDKAVSTIYATERNAAAWVSQLRNGTFTAGGVGIRSAIGDTVMGGTTSFAGQKLAFSVGDFHESLYNADHTYRVDVVTDSGVVYSQEISCEDPFYHVLDVDADAAYYYFEIYDVTAGHLIAIGNPIWNADK